MDEPFLCPPCPHCKGEAMATSSRGFARHKTLCKSNPTSAKISVADRVRKNADEALDRAEILIRGIAERGTGNQTVDAEAHDACDAFDRYRQMTALLEGPK